MNYIIWGAGQRGKRALNILGDEQVMYFVDSDSVKVGTVCEGKDVKSVENIAIGEANSIVLVSPALGQEEIISILEEKGINNYFLFDDCPPGINIDKTNNDILEEYDIQLDFDTCAIYGIGWFALFLCDLFKQKGVHTWLISPKGVSTELITCVGKKYEVRRLNDTLNDVQVILDVTVNAQLDLSVYEQKKVRYIGINDYLEQNIKFYNSDIAKLKNIHNGERCFIVATGPSLKIEDLDILYKNHEKCISMNRIYNIFSKTKWRPDYYVIEDYKMIEDLAEEIAELPLPYKFVAEGPKAYWEQDKAKTSIKINMITGEFNDNNIRFSKNVERCLYNGRTVTYACLQLAVYMGFTEIYLLGVDFNYSSDIYAENNHFEGYQNHYKDIRLNQVNLEKQLCAYRKARQIAKMKKIKIINTTRGGKLEVFERKKFDDLFQEREL